MSWSPQQEKAIAAVQAWITGGGQQIFRLFGYAGTGKEQPLSSEIQTPLGPVSMGSLRVGDVICGLEGSTVVTGVFPQGRKPVFKITFRDGSTARCGADHLWSVQNSKDRKRGRWRTMTTVALMEAGITRPGGDFIWQIPLCSPADSYRPAPSFDPYTMGALIGDGYLAGNIVELVNPDREIAERVEAALPSGMTMQEHEHPTCPRFTLKKPLGSYTNPWRRHLVDLGIDCLSKVKFLPEEYLFAPITHRIELLRGLMDTDGSCRSNRTSFSTSSERLAGDVVRLVQSLGGVAIPRHYERDGDGEFQINVKVGFCPFHLSRKAAQWSASAKNPPSRYIVLIEPDGEEEQQCISVSAEDNLYLTDNHVVTHNTTLARELAGGVKGPVLFGAFTGKAALMLQKKGCGGATTIHSMIYKPKKSRNGGEPGFKIDRNSEARRASLIVIDEVSMVDQQLADDLKSFGRPILVLGDPAQLPPVKGTGYFTEARPDVMLEEVHRQAEGSPIIEMSMRVRRGERLQRGAYGESRVIGRGEFSGKDVLSAGQVLVGRNKTRTGYNRRIRELRGFDPAGPQHDDRLVCLKNDHSMGLLNGGIWSVVGAPERAPGEINMYVKNLDAAGDAHVTVKNQFFEGREAELEWAERKGFQEFTYGYALTVHKAQGSQWDDVMVFDESDAFRETRERWLYTAITRAAERVTVVLD